METKTEFTAALEAGKLLARSEVKTIEGIPCIFKPDGNVEQLERLLPAPLRNEGVETFKHLPSFIDRLNKLKGENSKVSVIAGISLNITAQLNAPTKDEPAWGDWNLGCNLNFQPEWDSWRGTLQFDQDDFIEFLQEHGDDIVDPTGAELIELIQDLSASEGSDSQSFSRSFDKKGQVTYKQKVTGTDGAEIPAKMTINVPVWTEDDKYPATVLVQAKVRGAKPVFILKVKNPSKVVLQATKDIIDKIAKETNLPVYR